MPGRGIQHIDLAVTHVDRSLAFYMDLLGPLGLRELERYRTYRGTEEVVYLSFGDESLGLRRADGGVHRYYDAGLEHLAFEVDTSGEVDAAHERCLRRGDRIHCPPEEDRDISGYYAFFVFDPDGFRIEVFSPGPEWSSRIHRPVQTSDQPNPQRRDNAMGDTAETAILAGGCFWPAQELLRGREGVISTRVGYTGGHNDHPTEQNHPGHAEAVEIVFDPERISYRELLEFFVQIHRADLGPHVVGSAYRSEIFYTTDEQRQIAQDTIADLDAAGIWPAKVVTEISKACPFWEAEAEDQNYLQHYPDRYTFFPRSRLEAANPETAD